MSHYSIGRIMRTWIALVGLILSPLAIAHASSPPADSMHFCAPFDYEQWERLCRQAAGRSSGERGPARATFWGHGLDCPRHHHPIRPDCTSGYNSRRTRGTHDVRLES